MFAGPGHRQWMGPSSGKEIGPELRVTPILAEPSLERRCPVGPGLGDLIVDHAPQDRGHNARRGPKPRNNLARVVEQGGRDHWPIDAGTKLADYRSGHADGVTTVRVRHLLPNLLLTAAKLRRRPTFIVVARGTRTDRSKEPSRKMPKMRRVHRPSLRAAARMAATDLASVIRPSVAMANASSNGTRATVISCSSGPSKRWGTSVRSVAMKT